MYANVKHGIYKIQNTINGKLYIGSAINLQCRKNRHFNQLSKNNHYNVHLQYAFNKYGRESFEFIVLEFVENISDLILREQFYLDTITPFNRNIGYNLSPTAGSNLGVKSKYKGVLRPDFAKTITGSNNPFYGKVHTPENLKNQSEKQKGGRNHFFGKTHSDEFRKKSSIIHKGKIFSPELRAKLSAAGKGRKQYPEHIAKRIAARLNTLMNVTNEVTV